MGQAAIVGIFLAGLCAFVWTVIAREAPSTAGLGRPLADRLHDLRPVGRLRALDLGPRLAEQGVRLRAVAERLVLRIRTVRTTPHIRFASSLDTTVPGDVARAAGEPTGRGGSRLVAALELVLLVAFLGGIVAAALIGTGHMLMKGLAGHFHAG